MNKFKFWNETGWSYVFETSADVQDVKDVKAYVKVNVEDYDCEDIVTELEERGFVVVVYDEIPEENSFYWG